MIAHCGSPIRSQRQSAAETANTIQPVSIPARAIIACWKSVRRFGSRVARLTRE